MRQPQKSSSPRIQRLRHPRCRALMNRQRHHPADALNLQKMLRCLISKSSRSLRALHNSALSRLSLKARLRGLNSLVTQRCTYIFFILFSKLTNLSTFDQHEERVRAHANNRPSHLYRSFFEDSATLSAFVPKACHKKHKDVPHLKLADENAFQNHGDFHPLLDMTPERMRRQHQTPKKIDPSPFVSTFDNLGKSWPKTFLRMF
jgi:hypothetical protein